MVVLCDLFIFLLVSTTITTSRVCVSRFVLVCVAVCHVCVCVVCAHVFVFCRVCVCVFAHVCTNVFMSHFTYVMVR